MISKEILCLFWNFSVLTNIRPAISVKIKTSDSLLGDLKVPSKGFFASSFHKSNRFSWPDFLFERMPLLRLIIFYSEDFSGKMEEIYSKCSLLGCGELFEINQFFRFLGRLGGIDSAQLSLKNLGWGHGKWPCNETHVSAFLRRVFFFKL